jgi:hypothetical protein
MWTDIMQKRRIVCSIPHALIWTALWTVCAGYPAAAQAGDQGLSCGLNRRPLRYGVVLDASSSLTANRRSTEVAYGRVLTALAASLCSTDDSLRVYPFAAEGGTVQPPIWTLRPGPWLFRDAPGAAKAILDRGSPHTDLEAVMASAQRLFLTDTLAALILITDGSYFPADTGKDTVEVGFVLQRLQTLYERVAALRSAGHPVYAIGLGSDHVGAIDRALVIREPADAETWKWTVGDVLLDLRTSSGTDLLRAVFGSAFHRMEEPWVPDVLFGDAEAPWRSQLGYESSVDLKLEAVREISMEHLVFLPDSGAAGRRCPHPAVIFQSRQSSVEPSSARFCSVEKPRPGEIDSLVSSGVEFFFRQTEAFQLSYLPGILYGYHQIVIGEPAQPCASEKVREYVQNGGPWPPRGPRQAWAVLLGQDTSAEAGVLSDSVLPTDTLNMVSLPGSGCLVPSRQAGEPWRREGRHLLLVRRNGVTMLRRVELRNPRIGGQPRLRVLAGGFPPGSIAWLSICARTEDRLAYDESVGLSWGGRNLFLHPLAPQRSRIWCGARASRQFSSVVLVSEVKRSGYLFVTTETDPNAHLSSAEWYPVDRSGRGWFLMSWPFVLGLVVLSTVAQVWYWKKVPTATARATNESIALLLTRRSCTLLRNMVLVLVLAEIITFLFVLDPSGVTQLPAKAVIALSLYALKLSIAYLLPELVEDSLS